MSRTVERLAWLGQRIGKPPGWERLVRRFAPPGRISRSRDLCLVRDGLVLLVNPATTVGWNIAMFGTYEPEVRNLIRAVAPANGVAIDVGANIGWHTLWMGAQVGEAGHVLAFEPNSSVRDVLKRNLGLNRMSQAEVLPFAAGKAEESARFWSPGSDQETSGEGHLAAEGTIGPGSAVAVEVRRLDSVIEERGIDRVDLIKIDTEGSEWGVLQGARASIERFRPHLVFEFDANYAARGGGSSELLQAFFSGLGYRLFALRASWSEPLESDEWPDNANVWAVPLS